MDDNKLQKLTEQEYVLESSIARKNQDLETYWEQPMIKGFSR